MRQRVNRGIIGNIQRINLSNASGINTIIDAQQHVSGSLWPKPGVNATYVVVAGGGGGGGGMLTATASGGLGGGGAGTGSSGTDGYGYQGGDPTAGTVNTGGGGGGQGSGRNNSGASGGSGVVIIAYSGTQIATGGTISTSGGYTLHTYTTSGTFSLIMNN